MIPNWLRQLFGMKPIRKPWTQEQRDAQSQRLKKIVAKKKIEAAFRALPKRRKRWSQAARARQSEMMKQRYAKEAAEKASIPEAPATPSVEEGAPR